MISLSSLLNPAPPSSPSSRFPPSPASSSPTTSFADDSAFLDRPMIPKHKMPKDAPVFTKAKPKGVVNFYPHERLDEASLRLVRKFHVYPFGKIQEYSRHIPYNSSKKDFHEKTGRESFEVFQYVFRLSGDDTEYVVMWDYNFGLVRMTPFFKCCKYPKTTPAKMLNANPGLKDITHSITGGSIMAQGYWMPYRCAKAVCATFCHNIAGALIPIFGPDFPSLCTPCEAPEYNRMVIDPAIVAQSAQDAEQFRRLYGNMTTSAGGVNPKRDRRLFRSLNDDNSHYSHHEHRYQLQPSRFRQPYTMTDCDSPYATDTDGDLTPGPGPSRSNPGSSNREHFHYRSPIITPPVATLRPSSHHSGWTPANMPPHYDAPGPSPWLSALPRFTSAATHLPPLYPPPHPRPRPFQHPHPRPHPHQHSQPQPQPYPWRPKRPAEHFEPTYDDYAGGEDRRCSGSLIRSSAGSNTATTSSLNKHKPPDDTGNTNNAAIDRVGGADKNAALLLMHLSVRDSLGKGKARETVGGSGNGIAIVSETSSPRGPGFPRIKRVRSNSM